MATRCSDNFGIMYRNDSYYGDGVRDAVSIIAYEFQELGNTDAIEYILENYPVPSSVSEKWRGYLKEMEDNGYVDDLSDENFEQDVSALLECVSEYAGVRIVEALWLAERDAVIDYYGGDSDNISGYPTKNAVILSDLGRDGILWGYESIPEAV